MQAQQTVRAASCLPPVLRLLQEVEPQAASLQGPSALVHDLRGMIAIIASCAAALEALDEDNPTASAELAHRILLACKTMTLFVDDCLDRSKSPGQEERKERCDLLQLVNEIVSLHQDAAQAKQITLEAGYASRRQKVRGSAILLQRALGNVLANAIKFAPLQSTVRLTVQDDAQGVQIVIADQGPGIPRQELAILFDPYMQGCAKPTAGERGYGLGLAISKSVIEALGGKIVVQSKLGHGSIFTISLPLR